MTTTDFREALKRGDAQAADQALSQALAAGQAIAAAAFMEATALCGKAGMADRALAWAQEGARRHPTNEPLLLLAARLLRGRMRRDEALALLKQAQAANPRSPAIRLQLAGVHVERSEGGEALKLLLPLAAVAGKDAEFHRLVAGAYRAQGELDKAVTAIEGALRLKPIADVWLQREMLAGERGGPAERLEVLGRALASIPGEPRLLERRVEALAAAGRRGEAEAAVAEALKANPNAVWAHVRAARLKQDAEPAAARDHLRQAIRLEPDNPAHRVALAYALQQSGDGEPGLDLQEAAQLIGAVKDRLPPASTAVASDILWRTGDYEAADALGSFSTLGRYWAQNGAGSALLHQIPKVTSHADRLELLKQHRLWAERLERAAEEAPPLRKPGWRPDMPVRLGFLSSDLRRHPVAYFTEPLFEHRDKRFDLYCYSFHPGAPDEVETRIAARAKAYRRLGGAPTHAAAQAIADDDLDILIELGGATQHNRPEIMAYRPARRTASWLGYPHSLGLSAIDHVILDPLLVPTRLELMVETPLLMPRTWVCMGPQAFPEAHAIDPVPPQVRNGYVTFGTANSPYKYNPGVIGAWARVLAAVPGSRFMFVRPEAGATSFQANMARHFAAHGIDGGRLDFRAVRGGHMPVYNEIDVALDTFPLTGGTTTCEAMWMGVPTVSLRGEAIYERLSHSLLTNAGLGELSVEDEASFVATAAALAGDAEWLADLRGNARERLKASPLGQTKRFAADFYDLMAMTVA